MLCVDACCSDSCDYVMHRGDNVPSSPSCFCTWAPFALFRASHRTRDSQSHHLALSREREKRGNRSLLLSYLSLNKSLWWRQQAFCLPLSISLALSHLSPCSSLLNSQGASWTWQLWHFSHSPLLRVHSHMHLCERLHPFVFRCELETAYSHTCVSLAFSALIILGVCGNGQVCNYL